MIGFLIAAVSAAGLIYMGRGHHGRGYFGMRHVFRRLDTSPGQEKVIRNALDEMRASSREWKARATAARPELADLIRQNQVGAAEWNAWLGARVAEMNEASPGWVAALSKVHEVLDDRQRATLADYVEKGRGFYPRLAHGGCGGPHHWAHY